MSRSYTLSKVVNEKGQPILNAKVEAYHTANTVLIDTQYTDTNGECTFSTLPDAPNDVDLKIVYRDIFGKGRVIDWRYKILVTDAGDIDQAILDSMLWAIVFGE